MRPKPNRLEIAAYHEAGHVVMGFLVGGPSLDRVWITEEGNGKAESRDWWPVTLELLKQGDFPEEEMEHMCQRLERTIKTLLAGPIAELRFLGKKSLSLWLTKILLLEKMVNLTFKRFGNW